MPPRNRDAGPPAAPLNSGGYTPKSARIANPGVAGGRSRRYTLNANGGSALTQVSRIWTESRRLRRAAGARGVVRIVAAAGALLLLLASCGKNGNDTINNIKPIIGTISIAPIPDDPAVYFQIGPPDKDSVLLDVMFRSTLNAVSMEGYTLEIHYDQGVVQLGGELADGMMTGTPLGDCGNDCMASCGGNYCKTCTFCEDNNISKDAFGPALVCLANLDANRTGTLLIGVSTTPILSTIGCPTSLPVTTPVRLARLHLFAATTGTSLITLVRYPNNSPTGGCAILGPGPAGPVDQGIPCFDGGATFTAAR